MANMAKIYVYNQIPRGVSRIGRGGRVSKGANVCGGIRHIKFPCNHPIAEGADNLKKMLQSITRSS